MKLNKIYCEDCMETMSRMEDNFIDLTVTSPPYNFDKGSGLGTKYNGIKDNKSLNEYFDWSVLVIDEIMRVSKLVAYNIQMVAGNKNALLKLIGYYSDNIREILIWDKKYSEPAMNEKVFNSEFEFIFLLDKKGGGRKIDLANFDRGTVSNIVRVGKNSGKYKNHKACMPLRLSDKLVKYLSKENDNVYDPFMGSGTTAISSIRQKRNWIGSELSQEYVDLANKRLDPYLRQTQLF